MVVIICLDNDGGMRFNGRRQSRDRLLIKDITDACKGELFAADYSAELFGEDGCQPILAENPQTVMDKNGYYFAETLAPDFPYNEVKGYIIYRWNRKYPADETFDFDLAQNGYRLCSVSEFAGSSHDKITKEVWTK